MFVCVNKRDDGTPNCAERNSQYIRDTLKQKVKELGLKSIIRVTQTGCQDLCAQGPNIHIMPQNIWLSNVQESDIKIIIENYFKPFQN